MNAKQHLYAMNTNTVPTEQLEDRTDVRPAIKTLHLNKGTINSPGETREREREGRASTPAEEVERNCDLVSLFRL